MKLTFAVGRLKCQFLSHVITLLVMYWNVVRNILFLLDLVMWFALQFKKSGVLFLRYKDRQRNLVYA